MHGRGSELQPTVEWVYEVLLNRAYLDGTRYYSTPECFLYFLGRLLSVSRSSEIQQLLRPLFKQRLLERVGTEGDALALGMRIFTCLSMDILDEVDMRRLLPLQCEDGGWENGWVYKYGSSGIQIGNRGFTTAMAISAIEGFQARTSRTPEAHLSSNELHLQPAKVPSNHQNTRPSVASRFGERACELPTASAGYHRKRLTGTGSLIVALVSCLMFAVSYTLYIQSPLRVLYSVSL